MSDWPIVSLDELLDPNDGLSYGVVQPGMHVDEGVPIVRVSDLGGGTIATAKPLRVATAIDESHKRTRLKGGEVLLSIVGTVGRVAIVPPDLAGWNVARAIAVLRPKTSDLADWIYYSLQSPDLQTSMGIAQTDTVQATLNLADIRSLKVSLPSLAERSRIIRVLSALDNLVQENKRIIDSIVGLSRGLLAQMIADGCESVPLGTVAEVNPERATRPKPEQVCYLAIADVRDGGIEWPENTFWPDAPAAARLMARQGDVIWSRVRPNRRSHALIPPRKTQVIVSTGMVVLRPTLVSSAYLMAITDSEVFSRKLTALADGTTYPTVGPEDFRGILIPKASPDRLSNFDIVMAPLWDAFQNLDQEVIDLRQTRDQILPLLMTGRVQVTNEVAA